MIYAIRGRSSGQILTYKGKVIVHDNRGEMEFLFPNEKVIELFEAIWIEDRIVWLKDHPDNSSLTWPLRRDDFR